MNHYVYWDEHPHETRERNTRFKKVRKKFKRTIIVIDGLANRIKYIVEEYPEFCLDEIQMTTCASLKLCVPTSTT